MKTYHLFMYLFILSILTQKNFFLKKYADDVYFAINLENPKKVKFGTLQDATKMMFIDTDKKDIKLVATADNNPELYLFASSTTNRVKLVSFKPKSLGNFELVNFPLKNNIYNFKRKDKCMEHIVGDEELRMVECDEKNTNQLFEVISNQVKSDGLVSSLIQKNMTKISEVSKMKSAGDDLEDMKKCCRKLLSEQ